MKRTAVFAILAGLATGPALAQQEMETAIFAGGCFWCMEEAFDKVEGVIATTSGYAGGMTANPTYEQISRGGTGHAEALRVTYDPAEVTYRQLLNVFWVNVDPVDAGGQFCDRGSQYRSAIFPLNEKQRELAEDSLEVVQARLDRPIAAAIEEPKKFYAAEDYHQDYHQENPVRYSFYKWRCGREDRLQEVWGEYPSGPLDVTVKMGALLVSP